ncbi:MAG: EAL domain-containing protein [Agathobacter sp.]
MEKAINELTGLYCRDKFFEKADEFLRGVKREDYCMMAVDVEHFRLYNMIHGRDSGDSLLKTIADMLLQYRAENSGVVGYLGGDNFGIVVIYDKEKLEVLRNEIREEIQNRNNTVGYHPAFGIYHITEEEVPAVTMYDHATVALSYVIGNYHTHSCEYYPDMDGKIEEEIRILSEIQQGMDNDEFTFFVQPQCDIAKTKIVGGESLVRWIRQDESMVSPGIFIPLLEKNGFVADLDMIVWEKVCRWLRQCLDKGYHPVPISINISRVDIFSMDVPKYLMGLMEKYELDTSLLKVEITESAYTESDDIIVNTVKELQSYGFVVMMDDFGSGYSSLNMLKSVPVDVIKMDMRFLEINEQEEEKGVGILESVVNMARQMKVPIVVEGVEFKKHEVLLQRVGCRYTQGYYYYKPMSTANFEKLIADERNLDHEGFWCRQSEPLHIREFLDTNLFSDTMINNILGPVAFYDMYENKIEVTRVNEQYLKLAGIPRTDEDAFRKRFWTHVRDDDRQLLFSIFHQAYENQVEGASGLLHFLREDGEALWVKIQVFFLREKEGHKHFCGALSDMTEMEVKRRDEAFHMMVSEEFDPKKQKLIESSYGKLPCGYGIGKLLLNECSMPVDFSIVYANQELQRLCGGDGFRLHFMIKKLFDNRLDELLEKAYRVAYLGESITFHSYSNISGRYLDLNMYQYESGYVACVVNDVTTSHIYENSMGAVMSSLREAYFLHLGDNYCRMIHPDENHLLDRGNYEDVVNRHFATGKIRPYEESIIREFLSLERLKKALEKEDSVELKYKRSIEPAGEEWCLTMIQVSERENGIPKTAIITIRSIEALMREMADEKYHSMAKMLSQMSNGFFVYRAFGDESILYANPPVLRLFGCATLEELREHIHNSFSGMVYPEDLKRVQWEINEQIQHSDKRMDFICYRIITKDGQERWVEDCGHLENTNSEKDEKLFYVFISDITDTISESRKNMIQRKNRNFN